MENLKLQYRNLETKVLAELRKRVENSKEESKHVSANCIKVKVFNYRELMIINDQLTFLDEDGYHYSLFTGDCNLEDLIDILNS